MIILQIIIINMINDWFDVYKNNYIGFLFFFEIRTILIISRLLLDLNYILNIFLFNYLFLFKK